VRCRCARLVNGERDGKFQGRCQFALAELSAALRAPYTRAKGEAGPPFGVGGVDQTKVGKGAGQQSAKELSTFGAQFSISRPPPSPPTISPHGLAPNLIMFGRDNIAARAFA